MANEQTPFSQLFAPVPEGFLTPFWYGSLQSCWLYYRIEPHVLRGRLPDLPNGDRLEVALFDFGGGQLAGLASLDLQRYTGQASQFLETANEVEFNFYVYPETRLPAVPLMSWQQYLLGVDQTKTIGGYRLHVPCDNPNAVAAGKGLYGEPKYLAVFDCTVPSLNAPPSNRWTYQVYQDAGKPGTPVRGALIYGLEYDLTGAPSVPGSPSPLIEYGVVAPGGVQRVVANYWEFYGPFDTYLDLPGLATITLGTEPDKTGTIDDLKLLIGGSQPIAAQVYTSPPVSVESRGWFPVRIS